MGIECGILAHGFSRARCSGCAHDIVVAFSCKKRGVCPSCNARRMCDTAARLVDYVLPDVRLRQWVLSVPFELRLLLATVPKALSIVGKMFCQEIARWQQQQAGKLGYAKARGGAICFPQRFGGSLNLNVHFHVVAPDAAFVKRGDHVETVQLRAPTLEDLHDVTMNTALRVIDWLERKGFVNRESSGDVGASPLAQCLRGSLGLGELHPDPEGAVGGGSEPIAPKAKKGTLGEYAHFNVHAGVSIAAGCPQELERLLRYCARAPISLERLRILEDGRIAYQVKHAYRGRPALRIMTPIQFMARLAALIPPPRHPLIRFHGVLAPNSKWRRAVVPARPVIDALACPQCGDRLRFVDLVEDKAQAREILAAMGLPFEPLPLARARSPDFEDN